MGLITALITGLGIGAVGTLTRPDMPSYTPPPDVDLDAETLAARNVRRDAGDPTLQRTLQQQSRNALSLSRGELPVEVEESIRRVAAENAITRGLSADQSTRLTARDLGLARLSMMQQGYQLAEALQGIENTEWAVAQDSALGRANQMFEAYAMQESRRLAGWQEQTRSHSQFWGGLARIGGAAAEDVDDKWIGGLFKED